MKKYFVVALIALSFSQSVVAQSQQKDRQFIQELQNLSNPERPENSQFPPLVKEKLRWIESETKAGRFLLDGQDLFFGIPQNVLMTSGQTPDGKYRISVSVAAFVLITKTMPKVDIKTLYALSLVHEAIHLEIWPRPKTPAPDLVVAADEIRTWHKWIIGAIRPMKYRGYSLHPRLLEIEGILRSCDDRINCPAFVKVIVGQSSVKVKL